VNRAIAHAVADVNDLRLRDGQFFIDGAARSNSRSANNPSCDREQRRVIVRARASHPSKGLRKRMGYEVERCPARPPLATGRVPDSA
jgi:hypothetical protein